MEDVPESEWWVFLTGCGATVRMLGGTLFHLEEMRMVYESFQPARGKFDSPRGNTLWSAQLKCTWLRPARMHYDLPS